MVQPQYSRLAECSAGDQNLGDKIWISVHRILVPGRSASDRDWLIPYYAVVPCSGDNASDWLHDATSPKTVALDDLMDDRERRGEKHLNNEWDE